jgi:hypothetical protein
MRHNVFPDFTVLSDRCELLLLLGQCITDVNRSDGARLKAPAHVRESFKVRHHRVQEFVQQGVKSLRRLRIFQELLNVTQVALEVGREFDGVMLRP